MLQLVLQLVKELVKELVEELLVNELERGATGSLGFFL